MKKNGDNTTSANVSPPNTDLTALLASAMSLVPDNEIVKDYIAEAINAIGTK
jgi:hypothetical protein